MGVCARARVCERESICVNFENIFHIHLFLVSFIHIKQQVLHIYN